MHLPLGLTSSSCELQGEDGQMFPYAGALNIMKVRRACNMLNCMGKKKKSQDHLQMK